MLRYCLVKARFAGVLVKLNDAVLSLFRLFQLKS